MKENIVQRQIIQLLKKIGYLTVKEVLRCKELGHEVLSHRGIFGRINTHGVADISRKTGARFYRSNPYSFVGIPDLLVFKHRSGLEYSEIWIECKSSEGEVSEAQKLARFLFGTQVGGDHYILARSIEDVEGVV